MDKFELRRKILRDLASKYKEDKPIIEEALKEVDSQEDIHNLEEEIKNKREKAKSKYIDSKFN